MEELDKAFDNLRQVLEVLGDSDRETSIQIIKAMAHMLKAMEIQEFGIPKEKNESK